MAAAGDVADARLSAALLHADDVVVDGRRSVLHVPGARQGVQGILLQVHSEVLRRRLGCVLVSGRVNYDTY